MAKTREFPCIIYITQLLFVARTMAHLTHSSGTFAPVILQRKFLCKIIGVNVPLLQYSLSSTRLCSTRSLCRTRFFRPKFFLPFTKTLLSQLTSCSFQKFSACRASALGKRKKYTIFVSFLEF